MNIKNELEMAKKAITDYETGSFEAKEITDRALFHLNNAIALFESNQVAWERDGYEIYSMTTTQISLFGDSLKTNARHYSLPFILRLTNLGDGEVTAIKKLSATNAEILAHIPGVNELDYLVDSYQSADDLMDAIALIS